MKEVRKLTEKNEMTYTRALEILSPREIEVLKLVEKGYTSKEMSDKLSLSERTIHTHRYRICSKLNIKGRNGLIKWVFSVKSDENRR